LVAADSGAVVAFLAALRLAAELGIVRQGKGGRHSSSVNGRRLPGVEPSTTSLVRPHRKPTHLNARSAPYLAVRFPRARTSGPRYTAPSFAPSPDSSCSASTTSSPLAWRTSVSTCRSPCNMFCTSSMPAPARFGLPEGFPYRRACLLPSRNTPITRRAAPTTTHVISPSLRTYDTRPALPNPSLQRTRLRSPLNSISLGGGIGMKLCSYLTPQALLLITALLLSGCQKP